jgi:hypothetical protein
MTMSDVDDGVVRLTFVLAHVPTCEKRQPRLAEHKRLLNHVGHIRINAFEPRTTANSSWKRVTTSSARERATRRVNVTT